MPYYEFFCHTCKKTFTTVLTLVGYEEGGVVCPHWAGHDVGQRCSAFSVITSRKTA